mmetsp:Transcript_35250/g.74701  ORF Transcript_35250/g.74701 Transcript_35250/m.74701 type:complete len:248 (+) Transcript_35250:963-1706(+)
MHCVMPLLQLVRELLHVGELPVLQVPLPNDLAAVLCDDNQLLASGGQILPSRGQALLQKIPLANRSGCFAPHLLGLDLDLEHHPALLFSLVVSIPEPASKLLQPSVQGNLIALQLSNFNSCRLQGPLEFYDLLLHVQHMHPLLCHHGLSCTKLLALRLQLVSELLHLDRKPGVGLQQIVILLQSPIRSHGQGRILPVAILINQLVVEAGPDLVLIPVLHQRRLLLPNRALHLQLVPKIFVQTKLGSE